MFKIKAKAHGHRVDANSLRKKAQELGICANAKCKASEAGATVLDRRTVDVPVDTYSHLVDMVREWDQMTGVHQIRVDATLKGIEAKGIPAEYTGLIRLHENANMRVHLSCDGGRILVKDTLTIPWDSVNSGVNIQGRVTSVADAGKTWPAFAKSARKSLGVEKVTDVDSALDGELRSISLSSLREANDCGWHVAVLAEDLGLGNLGVNKAEVALDVSSMNLQVVRFTSV